MSTKTKKPQLTCPNCETRLDVDELLISQFEDSIRKDLKSELEKRERELRLKKEEFQELAEALQQEREDINTIVSEHKWMHEKNPSRIISVQKLKLRKPNNCRNSKKSFIERVLS